MNHIRWHIIEGAEGCSFAVANDCAAVVVDALRASATAAMLLHAGAEELLVVKEVTDAHAAKYTYLNALMYGERDGLPPEGFDFGNSPRTVDEAAGKTVIFTTTTGARRLVEAWGSAALYMGTTLNASAVARAATVLGVDVVLIPAGLASDPSFNAQEDWVGAAAILMAAENAYGRIALGEGAETYRRWRERIEDEGIEALFQSAPHADLLRRVGLEEDIPYCAQVDITDAVPYAVSRDAFGVRCRNRQV